MRPSTSIPWALAAASLALAAATWLRAPVPEPTPGRIEEAAGKEVLGIRLALAASTAEAEALRHELDRLLALRRQEHRNAAPDARAQGGNDTGTQAPAGLGSVAEQYRDALERSLEGDESAADEAYEAVMRLVRAGPEAFPFVRDLYLATADPRARALVARALLGTLGPEATTFVASQLAIEPDPTVRRELAIRASHLASPSSAPKLRDPLIEVIGSDADAGTRAAAVRGLRHLGGDAAARQALLRAIADPDASVRAAAVDLSAQRPELRSRLQEQLEREPDPEVRALGECRLRLAGNPYLP